MIYFGIDIGSSFIKGAILDPSNGSLSNIARRPFPSPIRPAPAGHFEINPLAVVHAVQEVIESLANADPRPCSGILFCGQMGGIMLIDHDGKPRSNYLSWRDQRTTEPHPNDHTRSVLEVLLGRIDAPTLRSLGNEVRAGSATSLLFWLQEHGQLEPPLIPIPIGDFVVSRLCNSRPSTEFTQALGTLNLETRQWHHACFERLGLDKLQWPALVDRNQPVGTLSLRGHAIPCYPVLGDHQTALAGAELDSGELSINVSTGSQASLLTDAFVPGDYQSRPYVDRRFLNTITHLPAGRSLDVLVDLLTEFHRAISGTESVDPWPYIAQAIESGEAGDTDPLDVNLAFFAGPMGHRGWIRNISTENLRVATLFRAALANMAENYRIASSKLSPEKQWQQIVFSGGIAQKLPLLRSLILEQLPGPSRLCEATEDTLNGLLQLARQTASR
jgi:xylulokinase